MKVNKLPPPPDPFRGSRPDDQATIPIASIDTLLHPDLDIDFIHQPGTDTATDVTDHAPIKRKPGLLKWLRRGVLVVAGLLVACLLIPVSYIWVTPPRTSFMLQNRGPVVYQYVSMDHISRYVIASTIAHEDQLLGSRKGAFEYDDFKDRVEAFADGKPDPSGSTIPQQLAKNIFFSADQKAVRKGLEAVAATELSYVLSDQRIMELYLNYAQFGPTIYGICAASWYYFDTPPSAMTQYQAAQLAGILPSPTTVVRGANGGIQPTSELLHEANERVPWLLAGLGGWEAAVATIGIHDSASDHVATQNASDGCSTMPKDVSKLLVSK